MFSTIPLCPHPHGPFLSATYITTSMLNEIFMISEEAKMARNLFWTIFRYPIKYKNKFFFCFFFPNAIKESYFFHKKKNFLTYSQPKS